MQLKKLEGMSISTDHSFITLIAAENNALQLTLAVKECVKLMIPHPEKGVASNGFNLQEAMGLANDGNMHNLL